MQCRLVLTQPATLQNITRTLVQCCQGHPQTAVGVIFPVAVLKLHGRVGVGVVQVVDRRQIGGLFIFPRRGVKTGVVGRQTPFHLAYHLGLDIEVAGDGIDFVIVQPGQTLLGAAQIEKQLALGLRRGNLDDAPVAQHKLMNLGLDPVHGEGDQPYPLVGVEAFDRLHQADIAFLNQVGLGQAVAGVAARNMHHEA